LRRRLTAAVALCAYLITTVGLPLPAYVNKGSVPFPCQHHACGCTTAAGCWQRCCCYSASEKLAWAREHNVDPPTGLLAEVAANLLHPPLAASDSTSLHSPKACCAEHQTPDDDHSRHPHDATCRGEHAGESLGVTFVLGIKARQCRGLTDFWCLSGAVVPPPAVGWQFQWNVVEWLVLNATPLHSVDGSPPVRPPRV
jgi:hypothetical protein